HGPFAAVGRAPAARLGLAPARIAPVLRALVAAGRLYEGELIPGGSGAELCDPDVLRRVRRDTLARLRNEVAPVDAAVLARFLPRWHGVGSARGGMARLREAIDQLEGLALPFSELERAILPARVPDFQPRMLDELGAAGEVVWVGQGALGSDDGRVVVYRREHVASLFDAPSPVAEAPKLPGELHRAILAHLGARGASFAAQLPEAAARPDEVVRALWDLVWLGLVTNDTFAPLRTIGRTSRGPRGRFSLPAGGRWSTLASVVGAPPAETVRAHTRALMLLERYGVVSREAAAAESLPGGFSSVSGVLRAMEESGKIRRGHFVDGLTGAQFAHAAAVDRLRAARDVGGDAVGPAVVVLSAIDPANPYGALLPWPSDGPRRVAGAKVVLALGEPIFFVERGGKKLRLLARPDAIDEALVEPALAALRRIAAARRHRQLRIEEVDGVPALHSPHAALLERGGFRVEPGALVLSADD
ncbi:MAG TPA: DEAD/DEAH box helicase, partial [Polyangia bacterium]